MEGSDEGEILAILEEKNDLVGTARRIDGRLKFVPDDCPAISMQMMRDCEGGAKDGDKVAVKSPAGEIRIEAKVTPRIVPGTIGIPQGAWHKANMSGDRVDEGACVNTLTTYKPTPLAKGNGPGALHHRSSHQGIKGGKTT